MAFSVVPNNLCKFMETKNGATDDFMAGLDKVETLEQPVDDLFPEEKEVAEVKEEKSVPFYKDEKVQRYIEKQIEKRLKDVKPTAQETFKQEVSESDPELVKAFTAIIGNDTPDKQAALKALENSLARVDERATQKAIARLQQVQDEQQQRYESEVAEAESELEEGRSEIEAHLGNELTGKQWDAYKDFLVKIEPKGGYDEYPDFVETFQIFRNMYKRPNAQAKDLASRGLTQSSSASSAPKLTREKGSLWNQVDKIFDK